MFEDIFEFLEPVLNVFTAVVIFSLGITICVGCIMLAFKACGRFNAFVREKAEKTINKWARRIDNVVVRIGERIGHFVKEAIEKTDKEKSQILSINMANNPRRLYKEVWIGLGGTKSAVYATEVSTEEYLCYTTEETEKIQVLNKAKQLGGDTESAIKLLANERKEAI